jgi:phosphoribosylanthranilate isomerase
VPVIPDVVVMPVVHVRDADSVLEAVRTVRPSGVDVYSGVRRGGRLDRALLTAFMAHVFATHG